MAGYPPGIGGPGERMTSSSQLGQSLDEIMAFVGPDGAPFSARIHEIATSNIVPESLHNRHARRPASEYGTINDSGYGTTSGLGKLSTGRRSVYDDSVASMSTVARLDVGGMHIDNQSTASYAPSEHAVSSPWTYRLSDSHRSSQAQAPPPNYILGSSMVSRDANDLFSYLGTNDGQSIFSDSNTLEPYVFVPELGQYRCSLCNDPRKKAAKTTRTISQMTKHIKTHTRIYKCHDSKCLNLSGFATEHDLRRHQNSCHKDMTTLSKYYMCPHGFCKAKKKPWSRWDNLKKHLHDVHSLKEEFRDQYLVKNTAMQERDLAGMGLEHGTEPAQTSVLSELDHIAAAKAHASPRFQQHAPTAQIPTTTQSAAQISDETVLQVENLQGPQQLSILLSAPALKDIAQSTRQARHHPSSSIPRSQRTSFGGTFKNSQLSRVSATSEQRPGDVSGNMSRARDMGTELAQVIAEQRQHHEEPWTSVRLASHGNDMMQSSANDNSTEDDVDASLTSFLDGGHDWIGTAFSPPLSSQVPGWESNVGDLLSDIVFNDIPTADIENDTESNQPAQRGLQQEMMVGEPTAESPTFAVEGPQLAVSTTEMAADKTSSTDDWSADQIQDLLKKLNDDGRLKNLGIELVKIKEPVSSAEPSAPSERIAPKDGSAKHACTHSGCTSSFNTKSSLRKHAKRHVRPFPCTLFCEGMGSNAKAFGSKDDWKRHELRTHFKRFPGEEWRCCETKSTPGNHSTTSCHETFGSAAEFRQHLVEAHGHEKDDKSRLDEKIDRHRTVPVDNRYRWCGFCRSQIPLKDLSRANADCRATAGGDSIGDVDLNEERPNCREGFVTFNDFFNGRCNHIDNHVAGRNMAKKAVVDWVEDSTDQERIKAQVAAQDSSHQAGEHKQRTRQRRSGHELHFWKRGGPEAGDSSKPAYTWLCCRCTMLNTVAMNRLCSESTCSHPRCSECSAE